MNARQRRIQRRKEQRTVYIDYISVEGQHFYSVINTHKNFSEESFYSKFAKDIPDFKYKGV